MSKHVTDYSYQQKLITRAFGAKMPRDKVLSDISNDPETMNLFLSFSRSDQEKILAFLSGEQTLQILYDKFFKKILDPVYTRERVESLLSAIYDEKVEIVEVLPKEGIVMSEGGSQVVMDIIIRLSNGSITTVEMQRLGYLFPGERSSCYLSDMMMRQYEKVRSEKGKHFSYKDLKNVNLIVIMEESSQEFKDAEPGYIHKRVVYYDSGAKVKTLENVTYISLDTFKKKNNNKISTALDAWLTFFTAEKPDEVLKLLESYPEFLPMYQEITEFRKNPEEVIGMFSEALKIMDRNTTKYMIDELHEQLEAAIQERDEIKQETATLKQESATLKQETATLKQESAEKDKTIADLSQTNADLNQTIEELRSKLKEIQSK